MSSSLQPTAWINVTVVSGTSAQAHTLQSSFEFVTATAPCHATAAEHLQAAMRGAERPLRRTYHLITQDVF